MPTAIVGPGTPYVTPEMLKTAPTGISWATIPRRDATAAAQRAEILNLCMRATDEIDTLTNQVLRATVDTEQLTGPDFRITAPKGQPTRVMLSRWPVLQVLGGQISANLFPRAWQAISADMFEPEYPIVGLAGTNTPSAAGEGGQSVLLAPGLLDWSRGRNGFVLRTTYINGWPHAGLLEDAAAGDLDITVDDCTGWAPIADGAIGATGVIRDGETQESFTVISASQMTGPGILTLNAPLASDHAAGAAATTLPDTVTWAAVLLCCAQALTRGATSTGVQSATPGATGSGGSGPDALRKDAAKLVRPYARVW